MQFQSPPRATGAKWQQASTSEWAMTSPMSDSLTNHSFESDLFKDSFELMHTNSLNDLFTNRMQNVKHTGNKCMKIAYMTALSTDLRKRDGFNK